MSKEKSSELELEFKAVVHSHAEAIKLLANNAKKIIEQAVALSEKHGIPFELRGEVYMPESFKKFCASKEDNFGYPENMPQLEEIIGIEHLGNCNRGWNSSAWCWKG